MLMAFGLTVPFLGAYLRQVLRGLSLRGFFHVLLFEGRGLGTGTISQEAGGLRVVGLPAEHYSYGKMPTAYRSVGKSKSGRYFSSAIRGVMRDFHFLDYIFSQCLDFYNEVVLLLLLKKENRICLIFPSAPTAAS